MFDVITDADLGRQIKSGQLQPGYLLFGEEDYLKHNSITQLKKAMFPDEGAMAFDYIYIDRAAYSAQSLAAALAPPPMLSERKLVVANVTWSDLRPTEQNELLELLTGYAASENPDNVLVLYFPAGGLDAGYLPKRPSAAFRKLAESLLPVRYDRVSPARLARWAAKHYEFHGVRASEDVCSLTVDHCGTDMFRLASEIDKISFFVLDAGRTEATAEDVRAAGSATEEYDTFALTNAMVARQYGTALAVLAQMKAQKVEPIKIMGEMIRVICDLNTVSLCVRSGMTQGDISAATGIKSYPLGRYLTALRSTDEATLRRALDACAEADRGVKGYGQDYIPIERLICSI